MTCSTRRSSPRLGCHRPLGDDGESRSRHVVPAPSGPTNGAVRPTHPAASGARLATGRVFTQHGRLPMSSRRADPAGRAVNSRRLVTRSRRPARCGMRDRRHHRNRRQRHRCHRRLHRRPRSHPTTPTGNDLLGRRHHQAAVKLDPLALVQPIDAVVAPNGEWWIAQRTGDARRR